MASTKKSGPKAKKPTPSDEVEDLGPVFYVDEDVTSEPPAEPDEVLKEAEEVVKPKVTPDLRPCFTARIFFRGAADPITNSFLHCESLRDGRIRKLPKEDWEAELKKFRSEER